MASSTSSVAKVAHDGDLERQAQPTQVEELAQFVGRSRWDEISEPAGEQLKLRVLDSLGCALGALDGEPVVMVREQVEEFGGAPLSTLIGTGGSAPDRAALYNGALVRYLDFNDSYLAPGETCHPSDNLAPVLAAAEYAHADGRTLLTALAVAYQVQNRLSEVAPVRAKGFDHTTQVGLLEPMRVEDEYQRRGLARVLLTTGLDRLARKGARRLKVGFETDAARNLYFGAGFVQHRGGLKRALAAAHDQHAGAAEPVEVPVVPGMRSQFRGQPGRDLGTVGERLDAGRDHHPVGADRSAVVEGEPEAAPTWLQGPDQTALHIGRDLLLHPQAVLDEAIQRYRSAESRVGRGAERDQ